MNIKIPQFRFNFVIQFSQQYFDIGCDFYEMIIGFKSNKILAIFIITTTNHK